jgi:hypothetical protein
MRTGLDGNTQATREYQHTNRRVTKNHPPPALHLLAAFGAAYFEEKIEDKTILPVDILSAISTLKLSGGGPLTR